MKITKKQIVALDKQETTVRELFPEVFETKLEVGKWYKGVFLQHSNPLIYITGVNEQNNIKSYGFNGLNWFDDRLTTRHYGSISDTNDWIPATKEEVETALINEAKRRGFKKGVAFNSLPHQYMNTENNTKVDYIKMSDNMKTLYSSCGVIENNGKWAEIIQPKQMTKEEIEKELGYEIEIKL